MSTPVRSRQRLPRSAGSASPAETQRRKASRVARRKFGAGQHRRVQGRHAVENRRPLGDQALEYRRRRRALGHQHAGRADRQRKGQRVAQAVGEKELGRGEHDVVRARCRASGARTARRSGSGRSADARRPSGCRSIPTNTARSRRRPPSSPRPAHRSTRPRSSRRRPACRRRAPPETMTCSSASSRAASGAIAGASGAETTTARARLSASRYS